MTVKMVKITDMKKMINKINAECSAKIDKQQQQFEKQYTHQKKTYDREKEA